jgi:hypothetical protein
MTSGSNASSKRSCHASLKHSWEVDLNNREATLAAKRKDLEESHTM